MRLEALKDFEWLNEPENVVFHDKEMRIVAQRETDFWQSKDHHFHRDNGHFFYSKRRNNFTFTVKWQFEKLNPYHQCGLMVRIDENNWIKASVLYDNPKRPMLGSSVTQYGYSDWAAQDIPADISEVWFRIIRQQGDYMIYYSLDGLSFKQMRLAHLLSDMPEVKVGAYVCNPTQTDFEAVLSVLEFKE